MNGYIYILKNPSFPNYIKIGYADDVEQRLQQLNNSECIPFAFRVYATYEVDSRLSDIKIHSIIDKLNPNLRSIDNFNEKKRVREFYAMTPEDAYAILEAIAEIHNRTDKLKKWEMSEAETQQEEIAEVVEIEHQGRAKNVLFSDRHIPIGSVLTCVDDPSIVCTVVNDRMVEYNGEIMYATQFARLVSGKPWLTTGPGYVADHFTYEGELIRTRQKRLDAEKSD